VSSAEQALATDETTLASASAQASVFGPSSGVFECAVGGRNHAPWAGLFAIDGIPALLLYGSTNATPGLHPPGLSPGADVAELNANLARLATARLDGRSVHTGDGGCDPAAAGRAHTSMPDRAAAGRLGRVRAGPIRVRLGVGPSRSVRRSSAGRCLLYGPARQPSLAGPIQLRSPRWRGRSGPATTRSRITAAQRRRRT